VEQLKFTPKRNIKSRVLVLTRRQIVIYKNAEQMEKKLPKNAIDFDKITRINEFQEDQQANAGKGKKAMPVGGNYIGYMF